MVYYLSQVLFQIAVITFDSNVIVSVNSSDY
jgi:hypothetical protein